MRLERTTAQNRLVLEPQPSDEVWEATRVLSQEGHDQASHFKSSLWWLGEE